MIALDQLTFDDRFYRRRYCPVAVVTLLASLALVGCGGGDGDALSDSNGTLLAVDRAEKTAQALGATGSAPGSTPRAWYVDAAAGNDGNAGTASAPWKTLARAQAQTLAAGESLLLKCGSVWRESYKMSATNAPSGGATLAAWGNCTGANAPLISGADLVSGVSWTQAAAFAGKPVYVAPWTKEVKALYWNGRPMVWARYPNYGGIGREFSLIAGKPSARKIVPAAADAPVLRTVPLAGARAVIRTNPWLVESHTVGSSDSSGAFTLKALANYTPQVGQGYFVEGKLGLLDSAGEWFHDSAKGLLYVWTPEGVSPGSGTLESVQRAAGIVVEGVADTSIQNIALERHLDQSLLVRGAKRTSINALNSLDAGITGVLIEPLGAVDSAGSAVLHSSVRNAAVMGIHANSPAVRIIGNSVASTGVGTSGAGVSAGVYTQSTDAVVQDNQISQSGFAAVVMGFATGVTVSGNTITQACLRFTDCGAIYSGGAPTANRRTVVAANAITAMRPNLEGSVGGAPDLVAGIYLDEESATHDVKGNMISEVGVGINLHNSKDHRIQFNYVWLTEQPSLRVHNSSTTDSVRGNLIEDNSFYASRQVQPASSDGAAPTARDTFAQEWMHATDSGLMFAGTNPNVVRRNTVTTMSEPADVRWTMVSAYTRRKLDQTQWTAHANGDSAKAVYSAKPYAVIAEGGNLLQGAGTTTVVNDWVFWSAYPAAGGALRDASCAGVSCMDLVSGSNSDFLMSRTFQMNSGSNANLYALSMRVQGLAGDSKLSMAINRQGGDGGPLGLVLMDQAVSGSAETTISTMFYATSSDVARLNIVGTAGKSVRLREVSLVKVAGYELFSPARESALLSNPSAAQRTVDCPTATLRTCTVVDLDGVPVAWPVTLAPGAAKVVLSADGKWLP